MANTLLIRTPTLKGIVDAIAQSDVALPTISYDEGAELHFIDRELLERIADIVRAESGATGTIPVTELSARILALESTSYMGTTWVFPEVFDYDKMSDYIDTYGVEYVGTGPYLPFDISFTLDGTVEYGRMEFHNNGDEGTGILFYYTSDPNDGYDCVGDWDDSTDCWYGDGIITLNEEPSAELLDFLETFAERVDAGGETPVYNGYIPLGKYTLDSSTSSEYSSIMYEDGEYETIPDWFIAYDGATPRSCFGLDGGEGYFDVYYGNEMECFVITDGSTIEVTREVEVREDKFNWFMSYFTPQ